MSKNPYPLYQPLRLALHQLSLLMTSGQRSCAEGVRQVKIFPLL